jgi:ketosteroid isomerase-like protein
MSEENIVRRLDQERRQAMLAADVGTLTELFSENLMWVHGTARVDTKKSFLEAIGSSRTRYLSIDVADESYRDLGDAAILSGLITMDLEVGGEPRSMYSRFTIVWHLTEAKWQAVHWQSTPVRSAA